MATTPAPPSPPPATIQLSGTPMLLGEMATVSISEAQPNTRAYLVATLAQSGSPACPAALSGECLDLPAPARLLASARTDAQGSVDLNLVPPGSLGERPVQLQVVQLPAGGPLVSNVWSTATLLRSGDADGDGLINIIEVQDLGTNPFEADSDGDGTTDGDELATDTDPNDANDPGDGWQLVWHDAFDGPNIDLTRWAFEVNGQGGGNNELQYYTSRPENARIEQGMLILEAREETYTGPDGTRDYTSARLRTLNQGDWLYGRFEARIRTPTGQGLWPAFWMLPTDWVYGGWAASGEIDIMELVGNDPFTVHGTLHYGAPWPGNTSSGQGYDGNESFSAGFHDYAVEWEEGEIRWYVDGQHTQTQTQWFSDAGPWPAPFDQRFHLLLNVAVGGTWPGAPDATTTFPQQMQVDWVRVYQRAEAPTELANSGFEMATGSAPTDWLIYPNTLTNFAIQSTGAPIYNSPDTFEAHTGASALKLWGQFTGSENRTPVYQEFPVSAGESFTLSGVAMTHPDDAIAGTGQADLRLLFFDSAYNLLDTATSAAITSSSPTDAWIPLEVTATAPVGTARMQASVEFHHCVGASAGCFDGGSVYVDSLELTAQ